MATEATRALSPSVDGYLLLQILALQAENLAQMIQSEHTSILLPYPPFLFDTPHLFSTIHCNDLSFCDTPLSLFLLLSSSTRLSPDSFLHRLPSYETSLLVKSPTSSNQYDRQNGQSQCSEGLSFCKWPNIPINVRCAWLTMHSSSLPSVETSRTSLLHRSS